MALEEEELLLLAEQLISLFKEYFPRRRVSGPMCKLYHELGVGGDDADEYLTEVSKKFDADMSLFESGRFFPDEGAMISNWPFKLFRMKSELDASNFESINFIELAQYVLQHKKGVRDAQEQ
jgi:Protein of unknown function (DUF1493)